MSLPQAELTLDRRILKAWGSRLGRGDAHNFDNPPANLDTMLIQKLNVQYVHFPSAIWVSALAAEAPRTYHLPSTPFSPLRGPLLQKSEECFKTEQDTMM